MGMATLTEDKDQIRAEFKGLKSLFDELKNGYFSGMERIRHNINGDEWRL